MEPLLFRGKSVNNQVNGVEDGKWVIGYYGILGKDTDIESYVIMVSTLDTVHEGFYFTDYQVDKETVEKI